MKWRKLGLVFFPDGSLPWARHSALTPTPILHHSGCIRVYAGFRDGGGVSRIGWVDVEPANPTRVLRVSRHPALDIGSPGTFDDNGVILGDIVRHENRLWMFYVGFQIVAKAKFLAFSGLAQSDDAGETFVRVQSTPVMDRSPEGCYIRAIHSVLRTPTGWRAYYAVGNKWQQIQGHPYPSYFTACVETHALESWPAAGIPCPPFSSADKSHGPRIDPAARR